jgi:hypothetical protein
VTFLGTETLKKELVCDKCGKPRIIHEVIRREKLGMMEEAASEALEEEHRKQLETETDPIKKEAHKLLAEAQAKMRKEGLVRLKMRCPDHSKEVKYEFFWEDFPTNAQPIKEHLFSCGKCGGTLEVLDTKTSGNFTIVDVKCPEHGSGKRKISTVLYDTIMAAETAEPVAAPVEPVEPVAAPAEPEAAPAEPEAAPAEPEAAPAEPEAAPSEGFGFCWNCGNPIAKPEWKFCRKCGKEIPPS